MACASVFAPGKYGEPTFQENFIHGLGHPGSVPQRLKPRCFAVFTARLKPCPKAGRTTWTNDQDGSDEEQEYETECLRKLY